MLRNRVTGLELRGALTESDAGEALEPSYTIYVPPPPPAAAGGASRSAAAAEEMRFALQHGPDRLPSEVNLVGEQEGGRTWERGVDEGRVRVGQ